MKKLFLLIFILLYVLVCKAQYPIQQNIGSGSTLVRVPPNGGFKANLINGIYVDTIAANLTNIDYYPGAQIFTTGEGLPNDVFTNVLWLRNSTATAWGKVSSNISSFSVINDSTLIICFSSGECDTLSINLNISINNIYNNSIVNVFIGGNDSCVVFENGLGIRVDSVCVDFIICDFNIINSTQIVVCPCPDTANITVTCDTLPLPPGLNFFLFDNGLTQVNPGHIEWGGTLNHNTGIDINYSQLGFAGRKIQGYPFLVRQYQSWTNSTGIVKFQNDYNGANYTGAVGVGWNYTGETIRTTPDYIPGYATPYKGYYLMSNGVGAINDPTGRQITDSNTWKNAFIFLHGNDTNSIKGVSIGAMPATFSGNRSAGNMSDYFGLSVNTDKTLTFQGYPNTRHDGAPTNVLYTDANGNVLTDTLSGGSVTVINDTTLIICSFGTYLCDTFYSTSGTVNIYNSDGTLLADRFVSGDGKELYIDALKDFNVTADDGTGRNMQFFMNGSGTGTERGFFTHNNNTQSESGWQTIARNVNDTLHEMRMWSSRSIPDLAWGGASGNTLRLRPDLFRLEISNATNFQISGMLTTTDTTWKPIVYNPADSSVKYLTNWPNLGLDSIRAYNGLTAAGSDSVKLGGTLTENTTINGNSDTLSLISLAKLKIVADTLKIKGKTDSITAPTTLAVWRGDTLMKARNGAARTLALIVATQPASGDGINSTNLDSYTIPANTFAVVGDAMVIEYNGNTDSTAGGVVLSVSFNSGTRATASLTSGDWSIIARYIYNSGTTFNASIKFEISIFCNGQVVYITNGSFSGNDLTSTMGSLLNVGVAPVGTNVFTYFGKFDFFPAN